MKTPLLIILNCLFLFFVGNALPAHEKKFKPCANFGTPFIYRLFRGMENREANRAFITFVALFGFPQIVAGIVEMLLIVFFFFLFFPFFFLSKGGPRSFYFALSFLLPGFRQWKRIGRSEWQGRDPLRGSTALSDEFMRDIRAGEWGRVSRESFGNYAGFAPRDFPQFKD